MGFRYVTADDQGQIYAATTEGDLLYYRDLARDGTASWAYGGVGQRIGTGWADFRRLFSGGDGIIYAVAANGDLLYYRDLARDGTASWAFGGAGQRIGTGWDSFAEVFSGGDGVIYAVTAGGDLLYYRDLARDGTANWAFGGAGQRIGTGWGAFTHVVGGGDGIIYAVAANGDLLYYRDQARDGTANWAFGGAGQRIGVGWGTFAALLSGSGGILYGITPDGFLLFYRDLARDGTFHWAYGGAGQTIGSGWFVVGPPTTTVAGYCVPLSAGPGETVAFKISAASAYDVTYLRLKPQANGEAGIAMASPWRARSTRRPARRPSRPSPGGMAAAGRPRSPCRSRPGGPPACTPPGAPTRKGGACHVAFVVKPAPDGRGDVAVLANTNTWNAYNDYGGRSKYSTPPGAVLSFERPNPATSPLDDGQINHLTRAESWVLGWLADAGYRADVYTDTDFHDGIPGLPAYKALVLSTHPEYWTARMLDNLQGYLAGGGSLLYLGGNGVFERVEIDAAANALVLLNGDPTQARDRSYFRNLDPPRPERAVLGVAYRYDNYMTFGPFRVERADHRFFAGTGLANGDLIGQAGRNGGGASGWEMDTALPGLAPDGVIVSASGADDRGAPPAGTVLLARGTNPGFGADMTCYETPAGGLVFSAGSISFGGSLVEDPQLQAIVKNVLNACLG